mgnify:CR=1 FL=1
MTFPEYWVVFVRAHASPSVRRVHFVSMSAALGCAVFGVASRRTGLLALATAVALVPTWLARRLEETRGLAGYPAFAAAASLKMWRMTLEGTMDAEVLRVLGAEFVEPAAEEEVSVPPPNMVTDHTLH